ncbi:MAG TPA: YhcH/YjgK/YiaL family protein [Phycisphaerae bacterium]|nr:YhcH/YjgK/YiaL family protein [Phycisphaerae bacterium]HOJ76297.1 YhcH/YjgK/YiaL family protein [Phycisphaerae bacterium]HOQ85840.1 YhcH/YjgK/YiaL family protein [Phycisphaerae bacterium]HPP27836.1 YhcH/YjgK/YiaL family protein [Phycisphaerae bacterium]HPU28498.1 YhcH/YjgK/YiaL family protein [Phycisphaerae bacterium]
MIKDKLENAEPYGRLGAGVARALEFLRTTDCVNLAPGKHEIDGQRLFAVVQRYQPKPLAQAAWEAHHRYIDVQYVAQGSERIGVTSFRPDLPIAKPYDPQTDLIFFDTTGDWLMLHAGEFAILTPSDVHAPGVAPESGSGEVVKVVVKIRVDERHPATGF